ncbi:hypothetical protein EMCRGX_G012755 [Ephydatia muelleri]
MKFFVLGHCRFCETYQMVFCLRYVDANLEVHEQFIGLYNLERTNDCKAFPKDQCSACSPLGCTELNGTVLCAHCTCMAGWGCAHEKDAIQAYIKIAQVSHKNMELLCVIAVQRKFCSKSSAPYVSNLT